MGVFVGAKELLFKPFLQNCGKERVKEQIERGFEKVLNPHG